MQDEFVYILEGRPTLVTDAGRTALEPGMCAGFKGGSGDAHHLLNETAEDVVYLEIGDRLPGDCRDLSRRRFRRGNDRGSLALHPQGRNAVLRRPAMKPLELGLDTFGDVTRDERGMELSQAQVLRNLLGQAILADELGVDFIGVGEHHRADFAVSAPEVLLAAIAARTKRIRLGSAVTVLSSDDPDPRLPTFFHRRRPVERPG